MNFDSSRREVDFMTSQELARLWDWQHRRAALGLAIDLPPGSSSSSGMQQEAAAAAAAAVDDSSSSSSDEEFTPATSVSFDVTSKQNVLEVLNVSGAIEAEKQQQQRQSGVAQQFDEALQSPAAAASAAATPSSHWMFAVEDVTSSQGKMEQEARGRV